MKRLRVVVLLGWFMPWIGGMHPVLAQWVNIGPPGESIATLAIDPQTPSTLYAGTSDGMFKSTNGGGNWTASSVTTCCAFSAHALAIDPKISTTIYVVGTMVSIWGSWNPLMKSVDGGGSWTDLTSQLMPTPHINVNVGGFAMDPQRPATLYAGIDFAPPLGPCVGVFESSNGGGSWSAIRSSSFCSVSVLVIDPQTPATLYAVTNSEVFKSSDGGGSWSTANNGLPNVPVWALVIDPQAPATLYAGTGSGVFKSSNGGENWFATGLTGSDVRALAIDPQSPTTVYAGTRENGVFKSSDGGISWIPINTGLTNMNVHTLAIDPQNPSRVYLGTEDGVFVSSEMSCNSSISPSSSSYSSSGITDDRVTVTPTGCGWTAASNDSWITITSGSSGSVNGLVTFSVAPNPSPDLRAGTLTIAGQTFAVTQAGLTSPFSVTNITPNSGPVTGGTSITLRGNGFEVGASITIGGVPARITSLTSDQMTLVTGIASVPDAYDVVVTNPGGQSMALIKGFTYTPVSGPQTAETFVPIVLSGGGMNGSFFTSELTLTNRGTGNAAVNFTYSAAFGGGSGTASDVLAPGQQKIVPDAISYLRSLGVPIPLTAGQGGTLGAVFTGLVSPLEGSVTVRTTTAVPEGRAGLAYKGVPSGLALTDPVYICGLRQNQSDRSNLAIQNDGSQSDGNITLRLTAFSGAKGTRISKVLPDQVLAPGGFAQINGILASNCLELSNGYVRVERINGTAPYYAYGVINDQANSDGSFIVPIVENALAGKMRLSLPAVVETELFSTELVVSNWSSAKKTLNCRYVADAIQTVDHTARFTIELEAGEQLIQPELVEWLRDSQVTGIGPKGLTYAGALFVSAAVSDLSGIAVAARTSVTGGGGEYGLFYTSLSEGTTSLNEAWLYDLQQNGENRTNLALVNTGEVDSSQDSFSIELYDGETGKLANTINGINLPAGGWKQFNMILSKYAPQLQQGYAHVIRSSGKNPFIAYAVVNDGSQPGDRSGDGTFVSSAP